MDAYFKRPTHGYREDGKIMNRREAREEAFYLLFEREFQQDKNPDEIYALSCENREIEEDAFVKSLYYGVCEHMDELDELLMNHSNGWKPSRMTPVSRCASRMCLYELLYLEDIPAAVSLNEAVELVKKFDDPKMRTFVNGLLNSAKNAIEEPEND
jgi:N utilization substance protein B